MIKKKYIFTVLAMCIPILLFWLGGFNFDHRGEGAFWIGFLTIAAGVLGMTYTED